MELGSISRVLQYIPQGTRVLHMSRSHFPEVLATPLHLGVHVDLPMCQERLGDSNLSQGAGESNHRVLSTEVDSLEDSPQDGAR